MTFWENMISFFLYAVCCTLLAIYSYGYLDFNLTLTQNPIFLKFVAPLQRLVYFERFDSVRVYVAIMIVLFVFYTGILAYGKTGKLFNFPWKFFLVTIGIFTIAYPMLSYDLYNYMFHGKILWFYHVSPHVHAPLEFTGDLWLRFMRWVHTPSAYGPVFTAIESPAYLLGLGKFVPVLLLMKLTMSAFFVWVIYLIGQITYKLGFTKDESVLAQLSIAFNPFILLEVVVNGHNDAVMIALFLLSLLYALNSKLGPSLISLIASVGTKYVTILTLPMYFIKSPRFKMIFVTLAMLAPVVFLPGRFQPWYLVWAILPASLIGASWSRLWIILASLAGLIYYIPYISTGFWLNSTPFVYSIIYLPLLTSGSIWFIKKLWMKTK
jgi:hypothetical protein